MAEYLIQDSTLTAIGDAIRTKTGSADLLSPDEMASSLNAVVDRTSTDLTASGATVTVPAGNYKSQATISVPTATQATPSISVDSSGKITSSSTQTAGYVSSGTKTATKQLTAQAAKTVTPSTSSQTAVASGVYTTGAITVAAMPTATQATPSISVNSDGKITATATQTAGYVSAGTKTGTKQLTVQVAQTITPGTSDQTIAAGNYLTGDQTIKGDANLVPENIASGVNIFGVEGTMEAGGVDTCTIAITRMWAGTIYYTNVDSNGNLVVESFSKTSLYTVQYLEIVCGSLFVVTGNLENTSLSEGLILIGVLDGYTLFQAPSTPGEYTIS